MSEIRYHSMHYIYKIITGYRREPHGGCNPGYNVTIPIPLVDRGRGDPRNIMGVIVERDNNDLYVISVRAGILKEKYSRNQFDLCTQASCS